MNKKTGWAITVSVLALGTLLAMAACSKKEETPAASPAAEQPVAAAPATPIDPATVATQLSAAETQNQALMNVMATVEKQSLFSYLQE